MPNLPISQLPAATTGYSDSLMVIVNYNTVVTGQTESIPYTAITSGKQNTLVSGSNIKTVNSQSLLGSGNLVINSGRNRVIGVKSNYLSVNQFESFGLILTTNVTVLDVSIQMAVSSSSEQSIRLYASASPSSVVGAVQLGTYTVPSGTTQSGRFIRELWFYDISGQSGGVPYADYYIKGFKNNVSSINDFNSDGLFTSSNIGSLSVGGILYPYLIATTSGSLSIESWVVEYGT
jgi:hypothetical protein